MIILLAPLLAWNAWLLLAWVDRFHLLPRTLSGSFTDYFLFTSFSFPVLVANWSGFGPAIADLAGVTAIAWLAGGAAIRTCFRRGGGGGLVRLAAGFGILGTGVLGAGLTGLLFVPPAPLTHSVLALLAAGTAWKHRAIMKDALKLPPLPPLTKPVAVLLALAAVVAMAGVLNLETTWDALTYHLRLPSFYLYRHKLFDVWHHYCAPFPSLVETLYTGCLMVQGEYLARFLNALFCVLLIPATVTLGRESGISPRWAPAMLAFSPLFFALVTRAYIDPGAAFFFTVSLILLARWWRTGGAGSLIAGGMLAGFGVSCKYTGAFFLVAVLAAGFPRLRTREGRRDALRWSAAALLPFLPWLAKNWLFRGNPVWPYLGGLFGVHGEVPPDVTPFFEKASPLAALASSIFVHAGTIAFDNGRVDGPLLPAVAGLLPLLALRPAGDASRMLRRAILGYLVAWFLFAPDVRFLLPILPALLLLLDALIAGPLLAGTKVRWTVRVMLEAGLVAGAFYGASIQWTFFGPFTLPLGRETAQRKLELGLVPPPWASYTKDYVNANLPLNARIMFLSHFSTYYYERECIADFHYGASHLTRIMRECRTMDAMDKRFRQLGIRWLLDTWSGPVEYLAIPGYYGVPPGTVGEFRRLLAERGEPVWQTDNFNLYRLGRPHPPRPLPSLPVFGWIPFWKADQAGDAGDMAGSLSLVNAAPKWLDGLGTTWMRRGDLLNALEDFRGAAKAYQKSLQLGLDVPRNRLGLSYALLRTGRYREALPHAEEAWRRSPLSAYAAANLASIEATLGNRDRALELLAEASRLNPTSREYPAMAKQLAGR